jgi:aryl-alcohol dehydrogenase-like predicted oxidoreductase
MGTYLGAADDRTDAAVAAAAAGCLASGVNVLDTAGNYRCRRAERSLGRAFDRLLAGGAVRREAFFVSTKAGYIPFDGVRPADPAGYVRAAYIETGIARPEDIVGGSQCIAPAFLRDQIGRSRQCLRLHTVDLFYLHNPEYMIRPLGKAEWHARMRAAFVTLEEQVAAGTIAAYGTATWDGFRVGPEQTEHLELAELAALAQSVGGAGHHFAAIQLPVSLAAPEAVGELTQTVNRTRMTVSDAAAALGVAVFASAPLAQGDALPAAVDPGLRRPGVTTPAQCALHWVRTRPGVRCALVGMKDPAHLRENLQLVSVQA